MSMAVRPAGVEHDELQELREELADVRRRVEMLRAALIRRRGNELAIAVVR
jgi:hypothetical protein